MISKVRNALNQVNADTQLTNRYLWSEIWSAAKVVIKQDADNYRKLYNQSGLWQSICVKMKPVSPIMCDCLDLPMDCVLYRSQWALPKILESAQGFVYRFISSPDLSVKFTLVTPYDYDRKSKVKYNREKYVFLHDGYLWAPNAQFPMLTVSGVFEDYALKPEFNCDAAATTDSQCASILDTPSGIPDYMEQSVMSIVLKVLYTSLQIQTDALPNANPTEKQISQ